MASALVCRARDSARREASRSGSTTPDRSKDRSRSPRPSTAARTCSLLAWSMPMISLSLTCAARTGLLSPEEASCMARTSISRGKTSPGSGTADCRRERSRASRSRASARRVRTSCKSPCRETIRSGSGTPARTRDWTEESRPRSAAGSRSMLAWSISDASLRRSRDCRTSRFLIPPSDSSSSSLSTRKLIRPLAKAANAEAGMRPAGPAGIMAASRGTSAAGSPASPSSPATVSSPPGLEARDLSIPSATSAASCAARRARAAASRPSSAARGASEEAWRALTLFSRCSRSATSSGPGGPSDRARDRIRPSRSRTAVSVAMLRNWISARRLRARASRPVNASGPSSPVELRKRYWCSSRRASTSARARSATVRYIATTSASRREASCPVA
mmetsp:Transcript_6517/g.15119  ORF Transcript_6517/g.15119 Transcript_6517/m.15119 type:complete len:391 (+) Transcript_6517:2826-3998(+)